MKNRFLIIKIFIYFFLIFFANKILSAELEFNASEIQSLDNGNIIEAYNGVEIKDIDGIDNIRGYGMMAGIDMKLKEKPGRAGFECFKACYEAGVNFKATGDCLIIAPQFICEKKHIDEIVEKLRTGISNYMKK